MLRWLGGLVAVLTALLLAFAFFAHSPEIAAVKTPAASSFSAAEVEEGRKLAAAGGCATCHTAAGGPAFAGGVGIRMPFGTVWSTNITPDRKTGIGSWSQAAFRRALRDGVARNGMHLYPAFPYAHFTGLAEKDIRALYAYLMTRPAVVAPHPQNTLPFPLNVRAVLAGWKMLFFESRRFVPVEGRSAEWNRGAYLAEALVQCGRCHTALDKYGAERRDNLYGGAMVGGWMAPALDARNPSPRPWDEAELQRYFTQGVSLYHGTALGPMAAVQRGMAELSPADIRALARYFAALAKETGGETGSETGRKEEAPAGKTGPAAGKAGVWENLRGVRARRTSAPGHGRLLYTAACAACHYNAPGTVNPLRPELVLNSALWLPVPDNFLQVVMNGSTASEGAAGVVMPAFKTLSDTDIATLGNWLRTTHTGLAPWPDLESKVAAMRMQKTEPGWRQEGAP